MNVLPRGLGYTALGLTPAVLLAGAVGVSDAVQSGPVGIGLVLVGAVAVGAEYDRALGPMDGVSVERSDAVDAGAVVAGALATYLLHVHAAPGPVLASALVGLGVGVAAEEIGVPAYCGSFAGMASPALFPSVAYVAAAGTVAGLAYVAADRAFDGFGGKLGTIAFLGCVSTASLTGATYAAASPLAWHDARLVVPVAAAGAVATALLSRRLGLGAVIGSALVGAVAAVALPAAVPAAGDTLAAVAFCASFVGMSASGRLDGEVPVALTGALCGVVFVLVAGAFPGAGGKLGTTAFVACLCYSGGEQLLDESLSPV
ncbi:hypothetical protein SAMN06269185_1540 [Natronoarchaeum philippinense]|uniref:Uncharacterized protein n=1 Tax=Natronoarchaeum philippinense TaxID=558529 RepID=A0A285NT70_NATPI|nr:hypothetical protein [Natronoarchaeum philippinense]SNZ12187.1 hypothetical protein SAMN06269185_1540 [Natronoarchaeum philippinense]